MDKLKTFRKQDLFELLPMFGRSTLAPVFEFSDLIGNPAKNYKTIHVAGTNGKGSVWHKIAEALHLGAKMNAIK